MTKLVQFSINLLTWPQFGLMREIKKQKSTVAPDYPITSCAFHMHAYIPTIVEKPFNIVYLVLTNVIQSWPWQYCHYNVSGIYADIWAEDEWIKKRGQAGINSLKLKPKV